MALKEKVLLRTLESATDQTKISKSKEENDKLVEFFAFLLYIKMKNTTNWLVKYMMIL